MLITYLMFLSLLGLGLFLLFKERDLISKGFRSYFWPHTKGVVKDMRSESYLITSFLGTTGTAIGTARQMDVLYVYEYHVSGITYCTENYCFGTRGEMFAAAYELGQHVEVYYDPKSPAKSVNQRGIRPTAAIGFLPIILASLVPVINWLLEMRQA